MKYLVAVFSLLLLSFTSAKADSVVFHTVSKHAKEVRSDGQPYNEVNPGIAYRFERDELAYQVGVYKNSWGRTSFYAGVDYLPLQYGNFKAGPFIGAATGYPLSPIMPMGGVTVRYDGDVGVGIRLAPPTSKSSAIVALEISIKL